MRRQHHVLAATLLIIGIIYLSAPIQSPLLDHLYRYRNDGAHGQDLSHGNLANPKSDIQAPVRVDPPDAPAKPASYDNLNHDDTPAVKHDFPFQDDLDLDFPRASLKKFSAQAPLHYDANGQKSFAYATFMATRSPSLKDPYFLAIQSVVHRVLWSPRTRTKKYPFIVFVADFVTSEQRALFSGAGAVVRELAPLEWHCDKPGSQPRWNDLFAKINMWAETDFERILFLDADAFPLTNIDDMFEIAPVQQCIDAKLDLDDLLPGLESVCEPYIFAGVPQDPFATTRRDVNVGSMVFTPSKKMHRRLLQNFNKTDHYDCAMAEQAFLNWQFGIDGAFPSTALDRIWGGFFPQDDDENKLKVVHEKIWVEKNGWLKKEWQRGWTEMVNWYRSRKFGDARRQT
ncbi:hypothetical protein ACEQ8H_006864 [Pleosporales sp. CAS-2024a]